MATPTNENEIEMNKSEVGVTIKPNATQPLLSHSKESKKSSKITKIIGIIIIFLIICIAIYLIVATLTDTWPFSEDEQVSVSVGLFGEWPVHGGNIENQQTSPNHVSITQDNIAEIEELCYYESINGRSHTGYMIVDDDDTAYFSDRSGFVTSVDLNNCEERWRVDIATTLGYTPEFELSDPGYIKSRNSLLLYRDKNGQKQVLIPTPNRRQNMNDYDPYFPCYLLSLDVKDGSLLWSVILGEGAQYAMCQAHGCTADENYAYCHQSSQGATQRWANWDGPNSFEGDMTRPSAYQGNVKKIDLNTHEIVDEWYTSPFNDGNTDNIYNGAGIWGQLAMYGDYLVVGTGNLYFYPDYVGECMLGDFDAVPLENVREPISDVCGNDKSNDPFWRCLEKDIYVDSMVLLDKNTFEVITYVPVQGMDAFTFNCQGYFPQNTSGCPVWPGADADMHQVAIYQDPDSKQLYMVGHQKSSQFFMVEIPSGDVKIAKEIGPWSVSGGPMWSLTIAQQRKIAIAVNLGSYSGSGGGPWIMGDGETVCSVGVANAIDLETGYTIWQVVNPYGRIGISSCNTTSYNNYIDYSRYFNQTCERAFDGSEMLHPMETTDGRVFYPDTNDPVISDYLNRAKFTGSVTVVNDMVFIPSMTGDVFVHNLLNGQHIHTLLCPRDDDDGDDRGRIRSGITVIKDRIVFYCQFETTNNPSKLVSFQIPVMS